MRLDPRLRVAFLFLIGVGAFFLRSAGQVTLLASALLLTALAVRLPPRRVLRSILKLWGLAAVVLVSYSLTREDPAVDRWVHLWRIPVNLGGLQVGAVMFLRVVSVALASQIARAGDPRSIAAGLLKLSIPRILAVSLDAVFSLLEGAGDAAGAGRGRGGGGGDGMGGGRGGGHRRREAENGGLPEADHSVPLRRGEHTRAAAGEGAWASLKRIARGDVGPLAERLTRQIGRADAHLPGQRDAAVIAGIALTMLGVRALKILPSLPFAPGHKLVLLTPLYIVATLMTSSRAGGTLTGLVMGIVAFLMGDGKYGIFELLKHVAPGMVSDVFAPSLYRRKLGGFGWSLFGVFVAAGRFATILSVVALVQAPKVAYAMLAPGLLVHCSFGAASGYVTYHLVKQVRHSWESSSPGTAGHTSNQPSCESPLSTDE